MYANNTSHRYSYKYTQTGICTLYWYTCIDYSNMATASEDTMFGKVGRASQEEAKRKTLR